MKKTRSLILVFLIVGGISISLLWISKKSAMKITVIFSGNSYHPLIRSEIQGKSYSLLVDTGASECVYLSKFVLDLMQKYGNKKNIILHDLKGNLYDWPIFSIPDVTIHSHKPSEFEIVEETIQFHENTGLWNSLIRSKMPVYHGRIGWQFFEGTCTLIDFPNSEIFTSESIKSLEKQGVIKVEDFVTTPFSIIDGVLVVSIETDLGINKVILDTGSTFCTLNINKVDNSKVSLLPSGGSYFPSNKLVIEGCNFGDWKFALTNFSDRLQVDGLLGCDFFLEHAVCLDFDNQMAYIQKPRGYLATQWKRGKFYLTQFCLRSFLDVPKVEGL